MRRLTVWTTLLLLSAAAPVAADWLVTHAGETIETEGTWSVQGSQVVFRTADGRLSSLHSSEIDLEASRALTEAPQPAAPAAIADPNPHRSVLVLTDADFPRAGVAATRVSTASSDPDDGAVADEDADAEDAEETTSAADRHTVEVLDFEDRVDVDENVLLVTGRVVNRGSSVVTDAGLRVKLMDENGDVVEERRGIVAERVLQPGAIAPFTAAFPGSPGFVAIEFELRSRGFRLRASEGQ